jgi:transcription initiation factor TFIIE subunit alpha
MLTNIDDATLMRVAQALGEEDAVRLIDVLKTVDETTDDEIATRTGIRLNSVRKILYKLYDHSLVSLKRTRDPKTGWFIFHWRLQPDQLEGFIQSQKRRVLEKLDTRLAFEKNHDFYYCKTSRTRWNWSSNAQHAAKRSRIMITKESSKPWERKWMS